MTCSNAKHLIRRCTQNCLYYEQNKKLDLDLDYNLNPNPNPTFSDLLVHFIERISRLMIIERGLSRVCGDIFFAFEDVWSKMGAQDLGRVFEPWSVRIEGGTVWSCSGSISKERANAW